MTFLDVDPATYPEMRLTAYNGRGAWTKRGFDFPAYRLSLAPTQQERVGKNVTDLDHWAVAAGCAAVKKRLTALGFLGTQTPAQAGTFNATTRSAVMAFQAANTNPLDDHRPLVIDGVVGTGDCAALFTPLMDAAESANGIPGHLLRGLTRAESGLDPGAVGYFMWYWDEVSQSWQWRGVDRGLCQINSVAQATSSWLECYDPDYAIFASARSLANHYGNYKRSNIQQSDTVLWQAAVLAHNNPSAGARWAQVGGPVSADAARYVSTVYGGVY